jgi:hypothetical protein
VSSKNFPEDKNRFVGWVATEESYLTFFAGEYLCCRATYGSPTYIALILVRIEQLFSGLYF